MSAALVEQIKSGAITPIYFRDLNPEVQAEYRSDADECGPGEDLVIGGFLDQNDLYTE